MKNEGFSVTPVDIVNLSFLKEISPIIYDGKTMPFTDKQFDKALIITVLHHTPYPDQILTEMGRVSKKLVVVEDIYVNTFHKYITYFFDSLFNLEFIGHPHSNRSDLEWKQTFNKLGFKLIEAHYKQSLLIFKHATNYVES